MPGSLRATIGDVDATVQGRPGHITRYEHAILQQLADLAARDYERLPSKIAARTPIQKYVSDEVMKMLGTLSHNVEEKAQDQRRQAAEQRQKAQDQRRQAAEQRQIDKIIKQNERLGAQQRKAPAPQVAADRNEEQEPIVRHPIAPHIEEFTSLPAAKKIYRKFREEYPYAPDVEFTSLPQAKMIYKKAYQDVLSGVIEGRPIVAEGAERPFSSFERNPRHVLLEGVSDPVARKRLLSEQLHERDRLLGLPEQRGVHPEAQGLNPVKENRIINAALHYNDYLKALSPEAMGRLQHQEQEKIRIKQEQEQEPIVRHPMDVGINEEERFPDIEPDFETLRHESFDPMVDEALRDNFNIGQQEIKASFSSRNKHLRDMILAKTLDVGKSPLRDAHEIGSFLSDKYRGMSSSVLDEMTENYLSNILPKANLGYMGGAWNSPQRRTHNEKVLSNLHKDVSRNLINLEAKTAEKGLEEAGQQRTRQLYAAKGAAEMLNQQQQEASRGAETLANLEKTKIGSDLAKIEAARTLGAEEQNFEGSRLEETQREALRQQEYPLEMIERQLGASRGIPTASYATHQQISQQPNYAAIGAGGIGNMATAMMYPQQQLQQRKSGGLIQKYAPGGFVLPKVENDPQTQLIEQEAQSLMNEPYNPQQALLHGIAKAGDKIAERYTGMPGIAGDMADTHLAHQEAHAVKRARGLNLIQQVQASRVKQQNFLAELEYKNKHHSETLGETSRHHQAIERFKERELTPSEGGRHFEHPEQAKQHYKTEQEIKDNLLESRKTAQEFNDSLSLIKKSYKDMGITGPGAEYIPDVLAVAFSKEGSLANRRAVGMEIKKSVLAQLAKQKGVQSDKDMAYMAKTLPDFNDPKSVWKQWIDNGEIFKQRNAEHNKFIKEKTSQGIFYQDAQNQWQDYITENPLFEKKGEASSDDGMVSVISPEGLPGKLPAHNLEKALARGYKRAA